MSQQPEHEAPHRATDSLDWRPRAPAANDPPAPSPDPPANSEPPRVPLIARVAAVAAGVGAIAGALAALAVVLLVDGEASPAASAGDAAGGTITVEQTDAVAGVARDGREAVVRIESTRQGEGGVEQDIGSGVVLDKQGHILTNAHVVLGTESLTVVLPDGSERPAILVGHDHPYTDIAVLQIGPNELEPVPVGTSGRTRLGEPVVVIGNPLAEFPGSVTVGVVSGLNRVRVFNGVVQPDLIQTDAAVNSGNSGGALLNLRGELIGIPTAVLREWRGADAVEGIAFALPVDRIMPVALRIIDLGDSYPRPTLGIDHLDLSPELASQVGAATTEGALVTAVAEGGPAAGAGLQQGDVITRVAESPISREHPLLNALAAHEPGERVPVVLSRGGRIIETEIELASAT